jgi:transcriptional regulator with XRE-family HTH domain
MSIGLRLKEEREKLGLNQTQLGAIGGVQKQSQLKYENEATFPKADYLTEIAKIGIDVVYVLFGVRADTAISDDEKLLLHKFRNAEPAVRRFMLYGGGDSKAIGQNFEGEIKGGQFGVIKNHN